MNTLTAEPQPELEDFASDQLPGRPRRRLLTTLTVPLLGLLLAAGGFLVGIEVEKSHGSGSASSGLPSAARSFASRFGGATGGSSGRTGARSGGFPGGGAGFPAGGFGGAGGGTSGTISSISGDKLVLKTTSGNSVTVSLTSATTLKKDLRVRRNSIRPGDTVTVQGITSKGGSIKASSISDSGASSSSSSSSSSSTSGSTSSGS
jgi:hypothetical protein